MIRTLGVFTILFAFSYSYFAEAQVHGQGVSAIPQRGSPAVMTIPIKGIPQELKPQCTQQASAKYPKAGNSWDKRKDVGANASRRRALQAYVLNASNETGIHPAIIETSLHLETNFGNVREGGQGEKGPCQFTKVKAQEMGLDFNAPMPSDIVPSADYQRRYPNSVWNPSACIMAKAQLFRRAKDSTNLTIELADGSRGDLRPFLFNRGVENEARALLSIFNRQDMIKNSLQAYYSRHGALPDTYLQAWTEKRCNKPRPECNPPHAGSSGILFREFINHNHVLYGVGLCREDEGSVFAQYRKSYKKQSGRWVRV